MAWALLTGAARASKLREAAARLLLEPPPMLLLGAACELWQSLVVAEVRWMVRVAELSRWAVASVPCAAGVARM
jgi:hypothetical protein